MLSKQNLNGPAKAADKNRYKYIQREKRWVFFAFAPVLVLEYLGLPTLTDLIIPKLPNTKIFDYFLCQKDNVLKTSHRQFFSCKG